MKRKIIDGKVRNLIEDIAKKSMRRTVGRTIQKELSAHLFITSLFNNFMIVSANGSLKGGPSIRARMQELVNMNIVHSGCQTHAQEFSLEGFVHEVEREFILSIK